MLSVPMFCRAAAALMLAAAWTHAPARGPAQPHPADPGAPVPATRYQSQSGYRPAPAEAASPDRNWQTLNRTVAGYDSMALTMPDEAGTTAHAAHAAHNDAHAGHKDGHAGHGDTHAGPGNPVGWARPARAPRAHADAGNKAAVTSDAHETRGHGVPTLRHSDTHETRGHGAPAARTQPEPAADVYQERPSHGAHASEGRR